MTKKVRLEQFT